MKCYTKFIFLFIMEFVLAANQNKHGDAAGIFPDSLPDGRYTVLDSVLSVSPCLPHSASVGQINRSSSIEVSSRLCVKDIGGDEVVSPYARKERIVL